MQSTNWIKRDDSDYSALEKLIPSTHLLRKVNDCIDFSFVNQLTENYYCPNNGRPSISPELYFRITLIGYLFGIQSNRRLIEEIKYNISYRWFCGLRLSDKVPHHASLSRIKKRLGSQAFEAFFEAILSQCQQAGLVNSASKHHDRQPAI